MNAVSAPISICPLSIRCAPNQSTATVEALKMTMTTGNASAMSLPTASAVPVYVRLAAANRSRSTSSRTKARTTRRPVICSRRMRLTESTAVCIERKCGTIREMISPIAIPSAGTATATSHARPRSSRRAMKMPPTIMIGADTMIARNM